MSERDPLVVFTPSGKRGRFPAGTPVLAAARALGVDVDSVCGGRAICGRCQVLVAEGEFAKHGVRSSADSLSAPADSERRYDARRTLAPGRRLSCQARIERDVVVDVPAESQVHRQVVRKAVEAHDIELDPVVRLHYVEVERPDMLDPSGDLRRLQDALLREWGLTGVSCELAVLQDLQPVLRAGDWKVTVAVHGGSRLLAVWPGLHESLYGVAVDVGSTTLAAHLCDLQTGEVLAAAGCMNPQIRYGEDLMSRVSYAMMNPGGAEQLTRAVREAVDGLVRDVTAAAGIDLGSILELTLVGNPVMHHLVLGLDPVELGGAPFALAVDGAVHASAAELGLALRPTARIYALPCIAGHVGADTAAVILAERPDLDDELTLLVDVGTNAEIVLGSRGRGLVACSSPTGPAFEGAQVSAGQRAAPGAIERVRIDRATLEPRFRVIGSPLWSDEPGFAESVAGTGVTGICGSGIIEAIVELFLGGVVTADGVVDGALAARSPRIVAEGRTWSYVLHEGLPQRLAITQTDVRAIQLAKAALMAGIRLLMERLGVERVDRVRLAGAFGAHIDGVYAMALGMIPDCDPAHVTSAGNAAGTGARIALLDARSRATIEALVRSVDKVETALAPGFQQHFVDAMAIPHRTAAYPELGRVLELPARAEPKAAGSRSGRRGRRP